MFDSNAYEHIGAVRRTESVPGGHLIGGTQAVAVSAATAVSVAAGAAAMAAVAMPQRGHGRHCHGSKTGPAAGGRRGEGGGLSAAAVAAALGRDRDCAGAIERGRVIGLWAPARNVKDEAEVGLCQPPFFWGGGDRDETQERKKSDVTIT